MSAATANDTGLNIEPGQTVTVKVVSRPNAAAAKTLARVLSKDSSTRPAQRRSKMARARAMTVKQRGGRPWEHRPTRVGMYQGRVGEEASVLASPDVIRDLNSVRRFVEVAPVA